MKTLSQINAKLRKQNRKNYLLLVICNLFSVMLITAYVSMMRSPTVLTILPEGGDSRKQVMAIFVLALIGCGVFTTYASSIFFRFKSKETGTLMALGASRKLLRRQLWQELSVISFGSCLIGALLGTPLSYLIWQAFRIFLVDTEDMVLSFSGQAYLFALAFSLFTIAMLFFMGTRFINRTNIIDILNEQRKSEPVRDIKPWYGAVGILLVFIGGIGGYLTPHFFIFIVHQYPPAWSNITYIPLFIGIYMILLHAVIRGFGRKKNRYKNIIAHSMMKFQGRQTVRNMLVITLLLAGAYFAMFYTPILGTSMVQETANRPIDYAFHYRIDQNIPEKSEIEQLAAKHHVTITSWQEVTFANLGQDGEEEIAEKNGKFHYEYAPLIEESNFLSASSYQKMTGQDIEVKPGKYAAVVGETNDRVSTDITLLTNMVTRETLPVTFDQYLRYDMMASRFYILNDQDYDTITAGLNDQWQEKLVYFNVNDVKESYPFAQELYNTFVDGFDESCEMPDYYDRVGKIVADEAGETYWGDTPEMTQVSYDERNSTNFKLYWKYIPQFRILDQNDFTKNMAVFLMLFIFIAIICYAAVLIIAYTRCFTIAFSNRQVYDDLRHLGANNRYLYISIRSQISKIYGIPAAVGTFIIYSLYTMIMYFNDNQLTSSEFAGLFNCFLLILLMSFILYLFYRLTLKKVCRMLEVKPR